MPGKRTPREGSESTWGLKDIRELIDVLIERQITEFEMEKGGVRIRIKRGNTHSENPGLSEETSFAPVAQPAPPPAPGGHASAPSTHETRSPSPEAAAETAEDLYVIESPIVGTFYATPSPNAPPFVKAGDTVEVGQVLCIIEAMKLMNEIESEVAGEVVRVYVENGQPVEYGQPLFAIRPSHKK